MQQQEREESHIVTRYRRMWPEWNTATYDYRHAKGARIAAIIDETGGVPRLALEVGVGPGGVASQVSRGGARVIGIGLSPDAATARILQHLGLPTEVPRRAPARASPAPDECAD